MPEKPTEAGNEGLPKRWSAGRKSEVVRKATGSSRTVGHNCRVIMEMREGAVGSGRSDPRFSELG